MLPVNGNKVILKELSVRFGENKQRSALEGVPFAVIDAIDALPYPTTAGTRYVRRPHCLCSSSSTDPVDIKVIPANSKLQCLYLSNIICGPYRCTRIIVHWIFRPKICIFMFVKPSPAPGGLCFRSQYSLLVNIGFFLLAACRGERCLGDSTCDCSSERSRGNAGWKNNLSWAGDRHDRAESCHRDFQEPLQPWMLSRWGSFRMCRCSLIRALCFCYW